jgi:predicted nucleic acid-binding protein
VPDDHSAKAVAFVAHPSASILISALVVLEAVNAMGLRVFRKERTPKQVRESIEAFDADIAAEVFVFLPSPPSSWEAAQRLSRKHTAELGCRSLDILQVATALVLKAEAFLTFDRVQASLARAEGLATPV